MAKPDPSFEIYAPRVRPERVPFHVLSKLFNAVQRLAAGSIENEESLDDDNTLNEHFGLLDVKRGSTRYVIACPCPEQSLKNIRQVGSVLNDPETIGDREFMLGPIEQLSEIARTLHSELVIREPGRTGCKMLTVSDTTYRTLHDKLIVKGRTSIVGKIERVGGATKLKCGLRVAGHSKMLICNVHNKEIARKLGQKLYEDVSVEGVACWLKTNWKVIRFNIHDVHQATSRPINQFLDDLRKAGGDAWDEIDKPEEYLNEMAPN